MLFNCVYYIIFKPFLINRQHPVNSEIATPATMTGTITSVDM